MTSGRSPNLTGQGPHLLQGHNTPASPGCCEGPAQSKRVTSQQPLSLSPPSSCPPPPADAEVCFVTSLEQRMLTGQTRTWFHTGHCLASRSFPLPAHPLFNGGHSSTWSPARGKAALQGNRAHTARLTGAPAVPASGTLQLAQSSRRPVNPSPR